MSASQLSSHHAPWNRRLAGGYSDKQIQMGERAFGNLHEQSIIFLVSLWMHALFVDASSAASLGWAWLYFRLGYVVIWGLTAGKIMPAILISTMPMYGYISLFRILALVTSISPAIPPVIGMVSLSGCSPLPSQKQKILTSRRWQWTQMQPGALRARCALGPGSMLLVVSVSGISLTLGGVVGRLCSSFASTFSRSSANRSLKLSALAVLRRKRCKRCHLRVYQAV